VNLPQMTVSVDIPAPPQRVWDVVTDISVMPRFSNELRSVEWAEGFSGAALGAQFLGTNRNIAIGEWTVRCEIVEFEPNRVFGWAVGSVESPAATWRFELDPTSAGTRLRYTARIGPGRSGVTYLISREPERAEEIVANRLEVFRVNMTATLEGIRELALV
jgi:uncharacterized protein YndB with AHSA1/START domain